MASKSPLDKDNLHLQEGISTKLISDLEVVRKGSRITIYKLKDYTLPIFLEKEKIIQGGNIKDISFIGNQITFVSDVKSNQDVTLAINFLDGWSGYINSKKVEVKESEEGFIKLFIPSGKHKVKLSYFPNALKIGLVVSLLSACLLILLTLLGLKQKRL